MWVGSGIGTSMAGDGSGYVPCSSLPFPLLRKVRGMAGIRHFYPGCQGTWGSRKEERGVGTPCLCTRAALHPSVRYCVFCIRFSFRRSFHDLKAGESTCASCPRRPPSYADPTGLGYGSCGLEPRPKAKTLSQSATPALSSPSRTGRKRDLSLPWGWRGGGLLSYWKIQFLQSRLFHSFACSVIHSFFCSFSTRLGTRCSVSSWGFIKFISRCFVNAKRVRWETDPSHYREAGSGRGYARCGLLSWRRGTTTGTWSLPLGTPQKRAFVGSED